MQEYLLHGSSLLYMSHVSYECKRILLVQKTCKAHHMYMFVYMYMYIETHDTCLFRILFLLPFCWILNAHGTSVFRLLSPLCRLTQVFLFVCANVFPNLFLFLYVLVLTPFSFLCLYMHVYTSVYINVSNTPCEKEVGQEVSRLSALKHTGRVW